MREKYIEELDKLKADVVEMANLSKEMLSDSIISIKTLDNSVADKVINQRKDIREFDYKIEEDAPKLIALYQPVAKDLRIILTALKMNTYLTRIGIYAKDISRDVKEISKISEFHKLNSVSLMGDIVLCMLEDAIKSFETEDLSYIADICERDNNVDDLFHTIIRESICYMIENPKTIGYYTHYMLIARYLERCGDHVCKISEKINYMITGDRVTIK